MVGFGTAINQLKFLVRVIGMMLGCGSEKSIADLDTKVYELSILLCFYFLEY